MPTSAVIALVDDDPSVCRAISRLLSSAGYVVETFPSGPELLSSGLAEQAACLLLDVHLIGMSGFELFQTVYKLGVHPPVIFMTAHDSEKTREQAQALGSSAYLRKPFEADALLQAVRAALATRAG